MIPLQKREKSLKVKQKHKEFICFEEEGRVVVTDKETTQDHCGMYQCWAIEILLTDILDRGMWIIRYPVKCYLSAYVMHLFPHIISWHRHIKLLCKHISNIPICYYKLYGMRHVFISMEMWQRKSTGVINLDYNWYWPCWCYSIIKKKKIKTKIRLQ